MLDKSKVTGSVSNDNVSEQEIARFNALAQEWWDPNGKYKTALAFNAARTEYMIAQLASCHGRDPSSPDCLEGLRILDVGCGGGLISEALAKRGAIVTGVDASAMSIEVARRHAQQSGLLVDYRHCLAGQLLAEDERFDVVINAEVVACTGSGCADKRLCQAGETVGQSGTCYFKPHRKVVDHCYPGCRVRYALSADRHTRLENVCETRRTGWLGSPRTL